MSIEERILDLPAFADYNDRLCKTIRDMTKENEALKQRIKRLEEAGNQMELVLISFQIFSDFRKSDSIRATLNWNKTKEAKP